MAERSFEEILGDNAKRIEVLEALKSPKPSDERELAIRRSIVRFADRTTKTDGSWTVINLVEDTSIPRPTLYRYEAPLKDFQEAAIAAPEGSGGVREELRRLRIEVKAEKAARKAERQRFEEVQSVLVQRLYALSLAYAQVTGDHKVVDLLTRKRDDA